MTNPRTHRAAFQGVLLPWLLWLTGLTVVFYPTLVSGFQKLQIAEGDPRLVHYTLEHSYCWLLGEPLTASFWDLPIFHPVQNVGAYTDVMLGAAPFYWVWRFVGMRPEVALELWVLLCFSFSFLLFYRFLRDAFRLDAGSAGLGAFLFAFAIPRLSNLGSPQLLPVFYGVLVIHALQRIFVESKVHSEIVGDSGLPEPPGCDGCAGCARGRRRWLFVFFAALILQTWSSFYPIFFLVLVLALAFLISLGLREPRQRISRVLRAHPLAILAGLGSTAVLIQPLVAAHLKAAEILGFRAYEVVRPGLSHWYSWIFPGRGSLVYSGIAKADVFPFETAASQHSSGMGFLTLVLCVWGCRAHWKRPGVRLLALTALATIVMCTRVPGVEGDASLWRLVYDWIPGGNAIRYPARIGMLLPVVAGVGVALLCHKLVQEGRARLALCLGVVCMAEQVQHQRAWDESRYRETIERIAAEIDPECESFVLIVEVAPSTLEKIERIPSPRTAHLAAMWAGLAAGVPTLNGSYGNHPPRWGLFSVEVDTAEKSKAVEFSLRKWRRIHGLAEEDVCVVRIPAEWLPWLFSRS